MLESSSRRRSMSCFISDLELMTYNYYWQALFVWDRYVMLVHWLHLTGEHLKSPVRFRLKPSYHYVQVCVCVLLQDKPHAGTSSSLLQRPELGPYYLGPGLWMQPNGIWVPPLSLAHPSHQNDLPSPHSTLPPSRPEMALWWTNLGSALWWCFWANAAGSVLHQKHWSKGALWNFCDTTGLMQAACSSPRARLDCAMYFIGFPYAFPCQCSSWWDRLLAWRKFHVHSVPI